MTKEPLTCKLWAKILAYFLMAVGFAAAALSAAGITLMWETNIYTASLADVKSAEFRSLCISQGDNIAWDVRDGDFDFADSAAVLSNAEYRVLDHTGKELWKSQIFDAISGSDYRYDFVYRWEEEGRTGWMSFARSYHDGDALEENEYAVEAVVDTRFLVSDSFYWFNMGFDLLWALRFAIYLIGLGSLALLIACFMFLLCGAGHRAGHAELVPGYLYKVPFDLLTAAVIGLLALDAAAVDWLSYSPGSSGETALKVMAGGLLVTAAVPVFTGWCASFAMRVKLGKWWENTLIYIVLHFLWRVCRAFFRGAAALLRGIPLVWKTLLAAAVLSIAQFLWMVGTRYDGDTLVAFWFVEKLILIPAALYLTLTLRKLQKGGEALAAGDLGYQTDTKYMLWDLKRHGENLNSIGVGMARAVEEQLRSERLKTELITNVSHDIKTPLTSIINYVDLLKRNADPEKAKEYMEVLDRQSHKLKKLTEDLVEVSKASTGNIEVNLSRRSAGELLHQVIGEYSERLWDAKVEAVLSLPERECFVWADGTLLWRVVDNLFSNVCKYALPGTRFYIDVRESRGRVVMSFKNISRDPLNVPADELMERFVRGDSARGGEGSGLGLNIARSLTELQGGTFALSVDGDLFKAELSLPAAQ